MYERYTTLYWLRISTFYYQSIVHYKGKLERKPPVIIDATIHVVHLKPSVIDATKHVVISHL